jgi:ATP-dependent DNA helicase RecG
VLVMTATPIPRTLSLTLFGDLDSTVIRHLPPGRQPIATRVVDPTDSDKVYGFLAERVRHGEQGYVVVPAVDESELGLKDVYSHMKTLATGPLHDARLEILHGRMNRSEREVVMDRFRNGEIDVLVATVVIEVGVDVANATMMVVEHAERFGLAQLHQLRGRVGRGTAKSVCAFIGDPTTDDGRKRLDAIAETNDGFKIAELDLAIRGPGELFGARQSGLPPLRVANLIEDLDLLGLARRDAMEWISRDPRLVEPDAAEAKRLVLDLYGTALGLGDVG